MRVRVVVVLLVMVVAVRASTALAQSRAPARPAPAGPAYTLRPFGDVGLQLFSAHQSFDAIFGSSSGVLFGGGLQVTLRNGFYFEVGASRLHKDGERAFLFNGQVFPLGIPVTMTATPFEVTGGYRVKLRGTTGRWLVPYAGGGAGSWSYKETSSFANDADNVDARSVSYHVRGGAEVRLGTWVGLAGEARYSSVPNVLGKAGISQDFGESNLGGPSLHLKVIVGRVPR